MDESLRTERDPLRRAANVCRAQGCERTRRIRLRLAISSPPIPRLAGLTHEIGGFLCPVRVIFRRRTYTLPGLYSNSFLSYRTLSFYLGPGGASVLPIDRVQVAPGTTGFSSSNEHLSWSDYLIVIDPGEKTHLHFYLWEASVSFDMDVEALQGSCLRCGGLVN